MDNLDRMDPRSRDFVLRLRESLASLERLLAQHQAQRAPGWWPESDARRALFARTSGIVRSVRLVHLLTDDCLVGEENTAFWRQHFKTDSRRVIKCSLDHLEANTRTNFFISFVSTTENSLRIFVRALDRGACVMGTADFICIYQWLLKRLTLQRHESLFDLLRLIRNTLHNNGSYFHKSGESDTAEHNGKTYNFRYGMPVDFVNIEGMVALFLELAPVLREIVDANEIADRLSIKDHGALLTA